MKRKTIYDMTLDELISIAYNYSEGLKDALRQMIQVRRREQVTKPRNAEGLHRSLKELADTVARLSKVDYENDLAEEIKKIEENNRQVAELNAKWKTTKTK